MRLSTLCVSTVLAASSVAMVGGCAQDKRHDVVPPTAMLGAEGERRLTYSTNGPGTLYVYDQASDSLVYSGEVDGMRQIMVDPERNEITVDGTLVQDKKLTRGHNHRIFFQPRLMAR